MIISEHSKMHTMQINSLIKYLFNYYYYSKFVQNTTKSQIQKLTKVKIIIISLVKPLNRSF